MAQTKQRYLFIGASVLFLVVAMVFFYSSRSRKNLSHRHGSIYSFKKLDPKTVAEISYSFDGKNIKKMSIAFESVLNEHYQSLLQRKQEVTFLEIYDQFLKNRKIGQGKVSVQLASPKRPLKDICQIYGRSCGNMEFISFSPNQKHMLIEGERKTSWAELKTDTVPYMASESEILNYLLSQIHENIRNQLLKELTDLRKKNTLSIIDEEIVSDEEIDLILKKQGRERADSLHYYKSLARNFAIDKYLLKKVIRAPILINIEKPSHEFPIKWEWTPYFGSGMNGKKIILFADLLSDASREMISILLKKRAESPEERYGFRPFFLPGDRFQVMAAEMSMCVWAHESNSFWDFLGLAMQVKRDSLEQDFYDIFKDMKLNEEKLKKCFLARDTKQAVEYHQTTAAQLKIINAPVIFVDDEVVVGPLSSADLEKMLSR